MIRLSRGGSGEALVEGVSPLYVIHARDGELFDWSAGEGGADLAYSLLLHCGASPQEAQRWECFARDAILAPLPREGGEIDPGTVRAWIADRRGYEARHPGRLLLPMPSAERFPVSLRTAAHEAVPVRDAAPAPRRRVHRGSNQYAPPELVVDGRRYVSAAAAAERLGTTRDALAHRCLLGRVPGARLLRVYGRRAWYVPAATATEREPVQKAGTDLPQP